MRLTPATAIVAKCSKWLVKRIEKRILVVSPRVVDR